jgi:predicted HTH domain antitoxin
LTEKKKQFKIRPFTAMMMLWSFILETISGIVLYVVPPGRVANWTNWKLWGLTKHGWGAVHTILGYVFLIFALLHIYFNWKSILSYIKRKIRGGLRMRTEMTVSLVVTLLITGLTIASIPPFSSIMDLGELLRNSWEDNRSQPFVAHAELLTLHEFTRLVDIPLDEALRILQEKGVEVDDPEAEVADIADKNSISPAQIYTFLSSGLSEEAKQKAESRVAGTQGRGAGAGGGGFGWKTIEQIAVELNVPIEKVMASLKEAGIDAKKTDVIRDAAEKNDRRALDLVNLIKEKAGLQK